MGFNVDPTKSTNITNKPIQVGENSVDVQINSVFTVEPQSEVNPALAAPVQNPAAPAPTSTENFLGYYNEADLRKYLLKPVSDNTPFEDLKIEAENKLDKLLATYKNSYFYSESYEQFIANIFPGEDGLKKAIVEAYFDVDEVFCAIEHIIENTDALNMESNELRIIYNKETRACNQEYNLDGTVVTPEIQELLDSLSGKSLAEKTEIIKKYLLETCFEKVADDFVGARQFDDVNADEKILYAFREIQTAISLGDTETMTALANAIILIEDEKQLDVLKELLGDCYSDHTKAELIAAMNLDTMTRCSKEVFLFIVKQYQKGGVVAEDMAAAGVGPDAIEALSEALQKEKNGEPFEVAPEFIEIFKAYQSAIVGLPNLNAAAAARDDLTPEEQGEVARANDEIALIIGEEGMRDVWTRVSEIYEQNPDWFQGIDPNQFTEIMNRISNGNYGIVLEDILRGDGVHSPLNMPEGNGSQGDGSGAQDGYDQSSGGYYVDPSVNYETQSAYISTLQQNIYMNSNLSPLPQRVVDNTPDSEAPTVSSNPSVIKTVQECREFLRNNANGVRDFLTGKVEGLSESVATMIIGRYKTMGKEQGDILAVASSEFFTRLQGVTKISAVRSFFAAGGKGNNVDRTRAMQEMIEEDEERRNREIV